jgi:hypothetical protein
MPLIVARWDHISFQKKLDLLQIYVLASWDDDFHRGTLPSAYFLQFYPFYDDFLTLASSTSNFNPLGIFA